MSTSRKPCLPKDIAEVEKFRELFLYHMGKFRVYPPSVRLQVNDRFGGIDLGRHNNPAIKEFDSHFVLLSIQNAQI